MICMWSLADPQERAAIAVGHIVPLSLWPAQYTKSGLIPCCGLPNSMVFCPQDSDSWPQKKTDHGTPAEEGWLEFVRRFFKPQLWASLSIVIVVISLMLCYKLSLSCLKPYSCKIFHFNLVICSMGHLYQTNPVGLAPLMCVCIHLNLLFPKWFTIPFTYLLSFDTFIKWQ